MRRAHQSLVFREEQTRLQMSNLLRNIELCCYVLFYPQREDAMLELPCKLLQGSWGDLLIALRLRLIKFTFNSKLTFKLKTHKLFTLTTSVLRM